MPASIFSAKELACLVMNSQGVDQNLIAPADHFELATMQLEAADERRERRQLEVGSLSSTSQAIHCPQEEEDDGRPTPPWRSFILKVFCSVSMFLLLTLLLELFAKEKVTHLSRHVMSCIGLPGLFLFVFLADGVPQPFTYVPLIFMAVKASVPKPVVFGVCAAASYCAALCGYLIGSKMRSLPCGDSLYLRLVNWQPWVPDLMERRGAQGVAMAALMPIPLALATWTAGSFRVSVPQFLLAGMFRFPKILVFVLLSGPSPDVAITHEHVLWG
ncbi:unnamed protein product [Polarella glacialis]|uniref:SNARE associated Golgi protein n=1 Tax=Polarella glacialis TaxID=89957 RepID=A0A813LKR6_POLGL|nr:unnamed protein product [Polarella glacialis]CAE8734879.1 unnamed protein product [Polarella glacialis]